MLRTLPGRVLAGHPRTFLALAVALAAWAALSGPWQAVLPWPDWPAHTRAILAWDIGAAAFLGLAAHLFLVRAPDEIDDDAERQEEGQWTIFWVMLLGTAASFAALSGEFSGLKDVRAGERGLRVALVAATLLLSWLLAHVVFAFRYAHDWYGRKEDGTLRRGLDFPGGEEPDYLDFLYFSVVLGMTFQVSDVQITARRLRRLALLHGLVSFLYNTVIVALTVNIAAGLL